VAFDHGHPLVYIYVYESVVVPIKDNAYFGKFSLLLARSAHVSNICIYLHSGDPHKGYSLSNGGHNISFGKCTGGLPFLTHLEQSTYPMWRSENSDCVLRPQAYLH